MTLATWRGVTGHNIPTHDQGSKIVPSCRCHRRPTSLSDGQTQQPKTIEAFTLISITSIHNFHFEACIWWYFHNFVPLKKYFCIDISITYFYFTLISPTRRFASNRFILLVLRYLLARRLRRRRGCFHRPSVPRKPLRCQIM